MKVLFISTMAGVQWGGSEVLWSKMADHFVENGHTVIASVFDWGELTPTLIQLKKKGVLIHKRSRINFNSTTGKIKGKIISQTLSKFEFNKLKKIKPDIVFFSLGAAFDLLLPMYSDYIKSLKVPYYCYLSLNTEYETLSINKIYDQRTIFDNANTLFFVSQRNKETAQRQICSELKNSVVINNPLTFSNFSPVEIQFGDTINFAMVARIDAMVKGHPIILKILSQSVWKERKWFLNIYGVGPDEEYVKELIKFYRLENRVSLKGQIADIKKDIWEKNHILLMPSQYEGCPISLYDAAVCGRAAIVSDVGGNAEFIVENENGYIAEAPSVKSFSNAMERFWNNKNKLKELGLNAHKHALAILDTTPHISVSNHILNKK